MMRDLERNSENVDNPQNIAKDHNSSAFEEEQALAIPKEESGGQSLCVIPRQTPVKGKAIGFTQMFGNFINPMLIFVMIGNPDPEHVYVAHVRLLAEESAKDCTILKVSNAEQELYCTLKGKRVTQGTFLKDPEDGKRKLFFLFPDLSVRIAGKYRIQVFAQDMTLFESDPLSCVALNAITEPFEVFTSRNYPGRDEPTFLTKSFVKIGAVNLPRLGMGVGYKSDDPVNSSPMRSIQAEDDKESQADDDKEIQAEVALRFP